MTESGIFTDFPKSYFFPEESVIYFTFCVTSFSPFIKQDTVFRLCSENTLLKLKKPASFVKNEAGFVYDGR